MKTELFIILTVCVFLSGCKNTTGKNAPEQVNEEETVEMKPELPEPIAEEVFLKGKDPLPVPDSDIKQYLCRKKKSIYTKRYEIL